MGAAEQVDGRNAGAVEARGVGRQVRVGLHAEIEAHRNVGGFDQPRPVGTRTDRLNGQAVVADAAHHVQVHVGRDLVGREDGVADEVRRAQQPEFLARPEGERDVPVVAQLAQMACGCEHRGRSRGVVVGAEVNGVLLVRPCQRVAAAAPAEMVVVGADDDPRLGETVRLASGQDGDHVARRAAFPLDRSLQGDSRAGELETRGVRVAVVEALLDLLQIAAGAAEQRSGDFAVDTGGSDSGAGCRGVEGHRDRLAGVR